MRNGGVCFLQRYYGVVVMLLSYFLKKNLKIVLFHVEVLKEESAGLKIIIVHE